MSLLPSIGTLFTFILTLLIELRCQSLLDARWAQKPRQSLPTLCAEYQAWEENSVMVS